jgi:Tol biopolymer transport system component/DNA-binding winged helix-turn-helix (wHTH) protein
MPSKVICFGAFEADLRSEELRKNGVKIRLRGQPFQVLAMLLERPGEVVTREELRQRLWPEGTFVDFDHSLNTAINKIREVLGDSAENPRFVETLARRGYRFIAALENGTLDVGINTFSSDNEMMAEPKPIAGVEELSMEKEFRRKRNFWADRLVWLAGFSVLLIGGVAWFYRSHLRFRSLILPPMKVVRLTSFPGKETEPTLSPDGKMVAFVWDGEKGDNRDIYVMLVDAGTPFRLTSDPGDDLSPAWSPDGRFIAFHRRTKERNGIYLVPSLGGPSRRLTDLKNSPFGSRMSWSPDGKYLAVSASSSPLIHSLFRLSVETGEQTQLTFPSVEVGDFSPAFSPNGQSLAFSRVTGFGSRSDIYTLPVGGGEPKRLTFNERSSRCAWKPDGREIIFVRDNPLEGLYRIPIEGGKEMRLVEGGQFGLFPSISWHGNRLVYSEHVYDTDIWRIDLPSPIDKAPSMTRLIFSSREDQSPRFSADGMKIVFTSNRSGSSEIWMCDTDGRNPVPLTSFGGIYQTGSPSWSPDGRFIAFDSRPEALSDIFLIGAEGEERRAA